MSTLSFGPKGDFLVTGGTDTKTRLWRVDGMQVLHLLDAHDKTLYASAFAPSGELVATACAAGRVQIWEVATGATVRTLEAGGRLNALAFDADGARLYGAGPDGLRVWQTATGRPLPGLSGQRGPVRSMRLLASRRWLATTGPDGVQVFDLASERVVDIPTPRGAQLYPVALHPQRPVVAAAAEDGRVFLWDARAGSLLAQHRIHAGHVFGVAFDPTGRILASGGEDNLVKLWQVEFADR